MKENFSETTKISSKEINDQQRARITQNFKAAKALLARKRPHQVVASPGYGRIIPTKFVTETKPDTSTCITAAPDTSGDAKISDFLLRDCRIHRPPLAEIEINAQIPSSLNGVHSLETEYRRSFPKRPTHEKITAEEHGNLGVEDGFTSPWSVTPAKQSEYHNFSGALSSPDILNDEFNDTILKEIDAICEQQTTTKKGRRPCFQVDLSGESHSVPCNETSNGAHMSLDSVAAEELPEHEASPEGELDLQPKELSFSRASEESIVVSAGDEAGIASHGLSTSFHAAQSSGELEIQDKETNCGRQSANTSSFMADQSGCIPPSYSEFLQSLNETQREAASSDLAIPLIIVAGPGSGKTSTMVGRVLTFLKEGIGPSHILAMTFTTAAASEMRTRIGAVTGKAIATEVTICTFHSFCLQLCRSHAEKLGRTSEFLIYGHGQQRRAVIEAVRLTENERKSGRDSFACKPEDSNGKVGAVQSFKDKSKKWQKFVTQAKASGRSAEEYRKMGDEIGAAILGHYNDILRSCNALDYHDFISSSVKLLTDFPEVYRECLASWKAMVVDEFQDTSAMQYGLLRILASHNCVTVIGDEDQSIFSFNGADISGFDSFRQDFPTHKEVRLQKNYRSTRCIVEAASSLIKNNLKRCQLKQTFTDNASGSKALHFAEITVKECHNEDAQCAFVVDKILGVTSDCSTTKCSFGSIAVLYRRQVSGKLFQTAFRSRKIPFNVHGVAFYRKKVTKAILAMLRTALPGCDDGPFRQVFKALFPAEKEEKKRVIDYIDKISSTRKCGFLAAACDIFGAKISGTFSRSQLTQGRKVLFALDMISKLVQKEDSISMVITSVANLLPQRYLLEQRAVIDGDGGKLLNEDNDLRSVLQYLLDDVSDFLSTHFTNEEVRGGSSVEKQGCAYVLKAFIDYLSGREVENFRSRRVDNKNSVSLTTIHQSKGLEWDIVFIVKANDSEIPLLHEFNGFVKEGASALEEERRLLYVAMTRARKKLYISYVIMDLGWQLLQPSRFLKEIPEYLLEVQDDLTLSALQTAVPENLSKRTVEITATSSSCEALPNMNNNNCQSNQLVEVISKNTVETAEACYGNSFLRRFNLEDRSSVSHLFHQWAKKSAFKNPRRLLDKVGFVVDERLRTKTCKNKDILRALKSFLRDDEAFQYAEYVLRWEQIPFEKRAHLMREKQEHFQKQRIEHSMGSSAATSKQISFLQNLGCTVVPTSRLHASHLIEQYKSLLP